MEFIDFCESELLKQLFNATWKLSPVYYLTLTH